MKNLQRPVFPKFFYFERMSPLTEQGPKIDATIESYIPMDGYYTLLVLRSNIASATSRSVLLKSLVEETRSITEHMVLPSSEIIKSINEAAAKQGAPPGIVLDPDAKPLPLDQIVWDPEQFKLPGHFEY